MIPREIANGRLVGVAGAAGQVGLSRRSLAKTDDLAAYASAEPEGARGIFETLLVAGGRPVLFDEHAARYAAGCAYFGLKEAPGADVLRAAAGELIQISDCREGVLRWSAWAGAGGVEWRMRIEPPRPHMAKPAWKVAVGTAPLPPIGPEAACKHLDRRAWLAALAAARAAGADEVLLADGAGRLVEGGVSNLFCVIGGRLLTPPLACGPLPGIVRAKVLALARESGLPVGEETLRRDQVVAATEIFLTNSLVGLKPVAAVDGRCLEAPGPITGRLQAAWHW